MAARIWRNPEKAILVAASSMGPRPVRVLFERTAQGAMLRIGSLATSAKAEGTAKKVGENEPSPPEGWTGRLELPGVSVMAILPPPIAHTILE
jgi:hypothetical protein